MHVTGYLEASGNPMRAGQNECEAEIERVADDLEGFIEDQVLDWMQCRFGWGWSCDLIENDFRHMEDGESPGLVATNEVLNPRTERLLVNPRAG